MTILLSSFFMLFSTTLIELGRDWMEDPNYSHGFFIPLLAVSMIWHKRKELSSYSVESGNWGIVLLVLGMAVHIVSNLGAELFTMRLAVIISLFGLSFFLLGKGITRKIAFPLGYLLFMVPIPAIIWNAIAFPLQIFSSAMAENLIKTIGISIVREGNVLYLANTTLEVVDACSGLRSLVSLLALSSAFAYFSSHSWIKKWLLFLSAIPIAIMANVFRLSMTAGFASRFGAAVAQGFLHEFSGMVVFLLGLLLLLGFHNVLGRLGTGGKTVVHQEPLIYNHCPERKDEIGFSNSPPERPSLLLTIDVEDWFQVENFKPVIPFADWPNKDLRVEKNTYRLLDFFDEAKVKATFFVLGWLAERIPGLVREIHSRGHEVASHGYNHMLCSRQSSQNMEDDLARSKMLLEDIIGFPVLGYRAPSFSISDEILKMVEECGYLYDSSFNSFGVNARYGRLALAGNWKKGIAHKVSENLYELPISNITFSDCVLPWGGGGYFRLIPFPAFIMGVRYILKNDHAYLFYLHPWEIDPEQPVVKEASLYGKFRHYTNLNKTLSNLFQFVQNFEQCHFTTCFQYLMDIDGKEHGLQEKVNTNGHSYTSLKSADDRPSENRFQKSDHNNQAVTAK
ncbi:MAG: XrtA system polysaccharide deacetylase [bacterium]